MEFILFVLCLLLAYAYAFVSGFTDAANSIATSVGSKALSPKTAVIMAGILEIAGALTGTAVALMIGKDIVASHLISLHTVAGALLGAMTWSLLTYLRGLPVSETHGLIGGIIGAALATAMSFEVIQVSGLVRVLIAVIASPALGFISAFLILKAIYVLRYFPSRKMTFLFLNLQRVSAAFMAFSHGLNDAQKPMGILVLALTVYFGWDIKEATIPLWVILSVGMVAGVGVAYGGWRIIKTLGMRLTVLKHEQGFAAEIGAAAVLQLASAIGIPVSTTHTITSAITGVGAARSFTAVRWNIMYEIALSWIFTLPATVFLGGAYTLLLKIIM